MRTYIAASPEDLKPIARELIQEIGEGRVIAFFGEMGVGKTTFIKELLMGLGVKDEVSSPTFSLVNEYRDSSGLPVYHFDFYRIEDIEEVYDIGYEDYFFSGNFCLIEWSEKIEELIPEEAVIVRMRHDNSVREIKVDFPS